MIWTILGQTNTASAEIKKLKDALHKKQPDAEELRFDIENFTPEGLDQTIESQGLFVSKNIVVIDDAFDTAEAKEILVERLQRMKESEHAFVIHAGDMDSKTVEELKKFSYAFKDFREVKEYKADFSFAEALGNRDSKKLWELYIKALGEEVRVEELHGQLVWQAKSMLLASETSAPSEAGMNDFPYRKAKTFAKNYSKDELEHLVFDLVSIYHDAHRGGIDLSVALEKKILMLR